MNSPSKAENDPPDEMSTLMRTMPAMTTDAVNAYMHEKLRIVCTAYSNGAVFL